MLPLMLTLVPTLERATHPAWNERLRSTSHVYFHPSLFHTTHAILNEFFSSPRIMDATLRCNKPNGGCRTPLVDKAVVTTCWSEHLKLPAAANADRHQSHILSSMRRRAWPHPSSSRGAILSSMQSTSAQHRRRCHDCIASH